MQRGHGGRGRPLFTVRPPLLPLVATAGVPALASLAHLSLALGSRHGCRPARTTLDSSRPLLGLLHALRTPRCTSATCPVPLAPVALCVRVCHSFVVGSACLRSASVLRRKWHRILWKKTKLCSLIKKPSHRCHNYKITSYFLAN